MGLALGAVVTEVEELEELQAYIGPELSIRVCLALGAFATEVEELDELRAYIAPEVRL